MPTLNPDPPLTLLLLHGAGGDGRDWPAALRQRHDVVALDLPGHGATAPPGCAAIDDYTDWVMARAVEQGLKRYVAVGHSMGGAIALTLALRGAPGLAGLAAVGAGGRMRVTPLILDAARAGQLAPVAEAIATYGWGPHTPAERIADWQARFLRNDPQVVYHDFLACDQFDVLPRLAEIQWPVLVLVGDRDQMTPPKHARYLAERLPQAQLHLFDNHGHMLPLEAPDELSQALLTWRTQL